MKKQVYLLDKEFSFCRLLSLLILSVLSSFCLAQTNLQTDSSFVDTALVSSNVYNDTYASPVTEQVFFRMPDFNTKIDSSGNKAFKWNKTKICLISGLGLSALGASYYYANNAWWKGEKTSFHLDRDTKSGSIFSVLHGPDTKYAKNIDKIAHFWGGVVYSDLFSFLLRQADVPTKKAGLYGALAGMAIQGFIEMKDGYAPRWGFSVLDVTAGTLGSFYSYSQNFIPAFAATDIKISYYKRDDYYFTAPQANQHPSWDEDYMNMTFWASYNPYRLMRHGEHVHPNWPKWLCISAGFGVDNTLNDYYTGLNLESNKGKGNYEFYIAPDIDFTGILPKNKIFQGFAKLFNRVKFPLPAIRFTPNLKFYPLYF